MNPGNFITLTSGVSDTVMCLWVYTDLARLDALAPLWSFEAGLCLAFQGEEGPGKGWGRALQGCVMLGSSPAHFITKGN